MAKLTVSGSNITVEDGVYEALLTSVEVCEPTDKSPNQKPWLKWTFLVYEGSENGQELTAASSTACGPKAKAHGWVSALLRRRLEPGEIIDTDTLSMLECQLVLRTDPETQFVKVYDVMQARQARPRPTDKTAAAQGVTV